MGILRQIEHLWTYKAALLAVFDVPPSEAAHAQFVTTRLGDMITVIQQKTGSRG